METATKLTETKSALLDTTLNKIQLYKNMSRSYWERWRWETQKRMEPRQGVCGNSNDLLLEIDPSMLINICDEGVTYLGRGSFGVVKLQTYCGIYVAVKELLPRTCINDVMTEAKKLSQFSILSCHIVLVFVQGKLLTVL